MTPVRFEPTISPGAIPYTYALHHAATGTGIYSITDTKFKLGVKFVNFLAIYLFLFYATVSALSPNILSIFSYLSVYDEECNEITKFLYWRRRV